MSDYTILHIQDFDEHAWQMYYDFLTVLCERHHYPLVYKSAEAMREEYDATHRDGTPGRIDMVCAGETAVAKLSYRVRNEGTERQAAFTDLEIIGDDVPPSLTVTLAQRLENWLERINETRAMFYARDSRLIKLGRKLGGVSLGLRNEFELRRENLNTELIATWLEDLPAQNPDLRMENYHEPPSEYFEEHARVLTTLLLDMPRVGDPEGLFCQVTADEIARDVERRRVGGQGQNIVFLFNEAGAMVGLSAAGHGADSNRIMHQGMSGLLPEYRGRGLAKWLKAATLDSLTKRWPDWEVMHTSMHESNHAIMHINAQLGFEKTTEGCEYTLHLDKLKEIAHA